MKEISIVKRLDYCGNSLVIRITKEAEVLGAQRGDYLQLKISKVEEEEPKTCNNCGNCRGWIDEGYGLGEYDCKIRADLWEDDKGNCPRWIPKKNKD